VSTLRCCAALPVTAVSSVSLTNLSVVVASSSKRCKHPVQIALGTPSSVQQFACRRETAAVRLYPSQLTALIKFTAKP